MKSLILYRHAKTERQSATGQDFDRPLTEQGRKDAQRMGSEIQALGIAIDRILLSPARRAVETAEGAGLPAPRSEERIYNASTDELIAIIEGVDDEVRHLMLVGHNPGFERLASRLLGDSIEMPTGSLLEIDLSAEKWGEAIQADGRKVRFLKPKELR